MSVNKCIFHGKLYQVKKGETINNKPYVRFSLSCYKGGNDPKTKYTFIDCVAYGSIAENFDKYYAEGDTALVEAVYEKWKSDRDDSYKHQFKVKEMNKTNFSNQSNTSSFNDNFDSNSNDFNAFDDIGAFEDSPWN